MLDRQGRAGAPGELRAGYEWQLAHVVALVSRRKLAVLRVDHREAIRDSDGGAAKVSAFLGLPIDIAAMRNPVDSKPRRQKRAAGRSPQPTRRGRFVVHHPHFPVPAPPRANSRAPCPRTSDAREEMYLNYNYT